MEPLAVKAQSERVIKALGGKTPGWLPWLDCTTPREPIDVASRALAMHALLQLYFGAPLGVISDWLHVNGLQRATCRRERSLIDQGQGALTEQQRTDLYWCIEALWTLVWAGHLIPELRVDQPVGDNLASLLPNIERGEDASRFTSAFKLRSVAEIYQMLDLYYRAHWYARDGHLNGYPTGVFSLDIITERRKALEWVADRTIADWDETPDST